MYPNCYPYIFNRKKDRKKKERSNKKNKKERYSLSNLQKVWFTVILQSVSRRLMKRYDYFRGTLALT